MILLQLAGEFFSIGLFSLGGGMATVPFLFDLSSRTGWFSAADLANMIAVSESTPGPIGINMATYVGFSSAGLPGALIAPMALTIPAFVIILFVSRMFQKFRGNPHVDAFFYGLRPASVGLIASALLGVCATTLFTLGNSTIQFHWKSIVVFAITLIALFLPKIKRLHSVFFILLAGIVGVVFHMAGP